MAGRQGQTIVAEVAHYLDLFRVHDAGARHLVHGLAEHGADPDLVARLELVEIAEGGAVGGAVPGDGGISLLARQGGVGEVAWSFA